MNNLGNTLTHLGRAHEAIAPLERAIQLKPRFGLAHNTLGVAFMNLGRADEGRAQFEAAVRLQPDYAMAHRNLGQALFTAKLVPEATQQLAEAVRLDPADAQARIQLGTALAMQAKYAEALPHFEVALELCVKAWHQGRTFAEMPTVWKDRMSGTSRFRLLKWLPHYLRWYLRAVGGLLLRKFRSNRTSSRRR